MTVSKLSGGLALALTLVAASVVPGHADIAKIGILSCDVSKGIGEILARKQSLTCQFKPDGGQSETYVGNIDEYGIEIGKVDQGHLIWGVASATRGIPQGALAGTYVGVAAAPRLAWAPERMLWSAAANSRFRCSRSRLMARLASTSRPVSSR